jgi:hypothetical protein
LKFTCLQEVLSIRILQQILIFQKKWKNYFLSCYASTTAAREMADVNKKVNN